jgi:hypothetical protein
MTIAPLPRRTLLQSGAALAGPLALGATWPRSSHAAPVTAEPADAPLSGMLAAWVVVEPDRGATVRLVQLDAASRPVRQVAAADLTHPASGASLQQVCQRAHAMAMEAVARSWGVPAGECVASRGRIVHEGRQCSVGYTLWVDVA